MLFSSGDTIIAPATAPGVGAIAVIRLSGKDAIDICHQCFYNAKGKQNLNLSLSHKAHFGLIKDGDIILDEVLCTVFRAPHSFTGENTVEISCHGSPYIQQQIIALFLRNQVRLAKAGEFTMRAFFNGKMELSQAEAVADVIAADTEAAHRLAMSQMRGGFSSNIKALRQELIDFAALMELELDFSEEDVEFANRAQFVQLIHKAQDHIKPLLDSFSLGNVIRNGVPVAIAGKPNAGKSTLLNALLNEERALVSPLPGTTRDTIEEVLNVDGIAFRFIDTAGLRKTDDAIEKMGVEKSYDKISKASILLYVSDAATFQTLPDFKAEQATAASFGIPFLLIANKADLAQPEIIAQIKKQKEAVLISAKNNDGILEMKQALSRLLMDGKQQPGSQVISNLRHFEGLTKSYEALNEVLEGISQKRNTELIALDLRTALNAMGELSGDISHEDVLDSIFSRFCIGK